MQNNRIDISELARKALDFETAFVGKSLKDVASEAILRGVSEKSLELANSVLGVPESDPEGSIPFTPLSDLNCTLKAIKGGLPLIVRKNSPDIQEEPISRSIPEGTQVFEDHAREECGRCSEETCDAEVCPKHPEEDLLMLSKIPPRMQKIDIDFHPEDNHIHDAGNCKDERPRFYGLKSSDIDMKNSSKEGICDVLPSYKSPFDPATEELIRHGCSEGMTGAAIARKIGKPKSTVNKWIAAQKEMGKL
jgi:hypothetical protein